MLLLKIIMYTKKYYNENIPNPRKHMKNKAKYLMHLPLGEHIPSSPPPLNSVSAEKSESPSSITGSIVFFCFCGGLTKII